MEPTEKPDEDPEAAPDSQPEEKPEPNPNSLANLKPGGWNKGIQGTGPKASGKDGMPRMLGAMYSVAEQEPEKDRGTWQKRARKLLERDDAAFDRRLLELEKAYLLDRAKKAELEKERLASTIPAGSTPTPSPSASWDGQGPCPTCKRPPEVVDEGTERVQELIRRLKEQPT